MKLKGALPLASNVIATAVLLLTPLPGLAAMALLPAALSVIRLPLAQVPGLLHCAAQLTLVVPVIAASQAWVLVLVRTARR